MTVFTLCSRLSSRKVQFYTENSCCVFLAPFGGLGAMYDDHLRLIGKSILDFLLVLIELLSLGVTGEALRTSIGWKLAISLQWGAVDPKFHVKAVAPTNHSSSQKTRLNDLSYCIKIRFFFGFVTIHVFHRRTDRRTDTFLATSPPWFNAAR